MLPRKRRLSYAEFHGRGYWTQKTIFFSLKTRSNDAKGPRIGVIVGKNVHKTAVTRNFWKRQARAVVAPLVKGDQDVILILQPRVNDLTRREFQELLKKTIRQTS